uniref:V-type proton ATPase subunit B 1 n=1 Tax=Talaromyces marneffei PM1 TaxID=1077442 RepID=A0A093UXP1_TALMA
MISTDEDERKKLKHGKYGSSNLFTGYWILLDVDSRSMAHCIPARGCLSWKRDGVGWIADKYIQYDHFGMINTLKP